MRTYQEFIQLVEQIPHSMTPTPPSVQKARIAANRRQQRHVHGELASTAQQQQAAKQNLSQFA